MILRRLDLFFFLKFFLRNWPLLANFDLLTPSQNLRKSRFLTHFKNLLYLVFWALFQVVFNVETI